MIVNQIVQGSGGGGKWSDDQVACKWGMEGDVYISLSGSNSYLTPNAFDNAHITSVNAPYVKRVVGNSHFASCTNLLRASLPMLEEDTSTTMKNIFYGCSNLETVDMPYAVIRDYAFDGCSKLKKYVNKRTSGNFPIAAGMFRGCSSLEVLDFTWLTGIAGTWAYDGDNALRTLILRRTDAVIPCNNANNLPPVFRNGGAGGEIYVPSSLIESYKTATNWSTAFAWGTITFIAIEGSQYEDYYADGTPIS